MASKKYTWILGLLGLVQTATFAQKNDANADWWKDSSKVSTSNMPQHNEFINNQYPYPPKPKNMWELGGAVGPSFIFGDVKSKVGIGGGLSLRKALGHVVSLRFGYFGQLDKGEPSVYGTSIGQHSYKTQTHMGALDVIFSLNSLSHYRGNPKVDWYILAGYDLVASRTKFQDPAAGGSQGDGYSLFYGQTGQQNTQSGLITTFGGAEVNGRHAWALMHGASFGTGVAFKVSDKFNIGVEQRFTIPLTGYDYLDAYKGGNANDIWSLTSIRFNYALGNAAKRVAPLWWINPNNFIYNELNAPKHMKIPTPVLPDADGDGITDQFDQEPNTPAGAPVDSHGVAKDTDGDGVPDYKDKELLTPQKCFPVNADGVGNCPEPECCKELRDKLANYKPASECAITDLPSIKFKSGTVKLSSDATALLASVAEKLNANPACKVKLVGYGASDKRAQQLSWDRVNAVRNYLIEKQGISESRLIFTYGQEGDNNTVDLQGTTEEGPNTVPAPHPNLKRTK